MTTTQTAPIREQSKVYRGYVFHISNIDPEEAEYTRRRYNEGYRYWLIVRHKSSRYTSKHCEQYKTRQELVAAIMEQKKDIQERKAKAVQRRKDNNAKYGKSEYALAAQEIRKELKSAFPGIKFSVKSSSASMTSSVDIRWTDGPIAKEVEKITGKYQYGHYDGMTDCYEYSNGRDNIHQAKWVSCNRKYSDTMISKAIEMLLNKYWNGNRPTATVEDFKMGRLYEVYPFDNCRDYCHSLQSYIQQTMSETAA